MSVSFSIQPVSKTISLSAGEVYEGSIIITNAAYSDDILHYDISVLPYGVIGENYDADLMTQTGRTEITKWVNFQHPEGELEVGTTIEVPYTITVPENVPSGGQYAAIAVSSVNDNSEINGTGVNNIYELTSILYATVTGETIREGYITENNVPLFSFRSPLTVSSSIDNLGNTHEFASVSVTASVLTFDFAKFKNKPYFEEIGTTDFKELVLPETSRLISRQIEGLPDLGLAKVNQTVYFAGESSSNEQIVILCPIWFAALMILTLLSIIVIPIVKIRKRKGKLRFRRDKI